MTTKHTRPDIIKRVVEHINETVPESHATASIDAWLNPRVITTLVTPVRMAPTTRMPWNRMLFESQISVTVLGPDYDQVADIADMVQEAVLSLSDHPATGVAIVIADSEPLRIAPHNPSGVEQISATYTLTVRGDRGQ